MTNSRPSRRWRAFALAAAMAALLGPRVPLAAAADAPLFVLSDPKGDDHGDGNIRYPLRSRKDMLPGQLDLLSFTARNEKDGTTFEAKFARPVTRTDRVPIDDLGTQMTDVYRLGFYTFNIDVYIDTDGVPGSGNTRLLPGRNAEVEPAHAWEKAVCLTPLPNEAEGVLSRALAADQRKQALETQAGDGRLTGEEKKEIKAEVKRQTQISVFFPQRADIFGATVRFFVPMAFLGGPAKAEWGYVIGVSGTDESGRIDLLKAAGLKKDAPMDPLYIMRVAPVPTQNTFGGADEANPAPCALIDIVVPPGTTQEKVLADYNVRQERPVRLPAVVPSKLAAPAAR